LASGVGRDRRGGDGDGGGRDALGAENVIGVYMPAPDPSEDEEQEKIHTRALGDARGWRWSSATSAPSLPRWR
jgi:hypothetical protein